MRRKNAQKLIAAGAVVTVGTDNYWAVGAGAGPHAEARGPGPRHRHDHGDRGAGRAGHDADAGDGRRARRTAPSRRGRSADLGTIEAGKIADLLVLDANPLADIKNIRAIRVVMANGQVVDRARLPETRVLSRAPTAGQ